MTVTTKSLMLDLLNAIEYATFEELTYEVLTQLPGCTTYKDASHRVNRVLNTSSFKYDVLNESYSI